MAVGCRRSHSGGVSVTVTGVPPSETVMSTGSSEPYSRARSATRLGCSQSSPRRATSSTVVPGSGCSACGTSVTV